jgi:hypothetical protein
VPAEPPNHPICPGGSGGQADLASLYIGLGRDAGTRQQDQTGGDGRTDPRSLAFRIEASRWTVANAAVSTIASEFARRQRQVTALETEFIAQFGAAAGGTDSIK